MRLARLVTALIAFLMPLLIVSPSSAYDQRTRWYSVRVVPPNPEAKHLFLTQTSNGLRLEPYRSGDVSQQWAGVQPDYPTAAAVTGGGSVSDIFGECLNADLLPDCDFQGQGGATIRLVSRSSGRCIAVGATRATAINCSQDANEVGWQRLKITYGLNSIEASSVTFKTAAGNCLTANTDDPYGQSVRLKATACGQSTDWSVRFTAQVAADLTCRTDWDWNLCFVEGQGR